MRRDKIYRAVRAVCRKCADRGGFTLIELIMVIIVVGILAGIVAQKIASVGNSAKLEETRSEMDRLAEAIVGNPDIVNNGTRSDFGYVGDVGALPPDLDALHTNPGFVTWHGRYIENSFSQQPDDFKNDAWQQEYVFSGLAITSLGSGAPIERRLAGSTDHLLRNLVSGNLFDRDGTPPGGVYKDSLAVLLSFPDGAGGIIARVSSVDNGGFFAFDSIPIGNHALEIVYLPSHDTLHRFVSVIPNSQAYSEYLFAVDLWNPTGSTGGRVEYITDSDTLLTANCFKLVFWIRNTRSSPVTVSSLILTWDSPAAYYKTITWNGATVRNGNPALGSGNIAVFSAAQTINAGETARIQIDAFHQNPNGGGPAVDMTGAEFTAAFSDGSTITLTADLCE